MGNQNNNADKDTGRGIAIKMMAEALAITEYRHSNNTLA